MTKRTQRQSVSHKRARPRASASVDPKKASAGSKSASRTRKPPSSSSKRSTSAGPTCKDCVIEGVKTKREAKYPGPRCYTHHRAVLAERRARARAAHVERTYSITEEQYQAILAAQGGTCYICRRARGTGRRRLAVDHDHSCCPGPVSCGRCVRGLLCKPCNRDVLGHLRDDPEALQRAIQYLENPPAKAVLGL